jgi:DNA-binding transcriptional LysR family regulator
MTPHRQHPHHRLRDLFRRGQALHRNARGDARRPPLIAGGGTNVLQRRTQLFFHPCEHRPHGGRIADVGAHRQRCAASCLDPLFPGEDFAIHAHVVGEFDDSAMMKTFGQSRAGMFFAPTVIAAQVCGQYGVVALGQVDAVVEQVYAITTERRMSHPATVAINMVARDTLFA